jgi:hypothetical protein
MWKFFIWQGSKTVDRLNLSNLLSFFMVFLGTVSDNHCIINKIPKI